VQLAVGKEAPPAAEIRVRLMDRATATVPAAQATAAITSSEIEKLFQNLPLLKENAKATM